MENDCFLKDYTTFIKNLFLQQDIKYKEFTKKILGVEKDIIGIQIPKLKKIAKNISQNDWKSFLKNIKNNYYEEEIIEGLIIGYIKLSYNERIKYLDNFIRHIDNWSVCDTTIANLKFLKLEKDSYFNFIKECSTSNENWKIRFGIVTFLNYYLTDKYIDEILNIVFNLKNQYYYVNMAQAWLISTAFIHYPDKVKNYLSLNTLDNWTQNKAIQKIRDSRKVNSIDKNILLNYKRRKESKLID